mmetsp:Transcript_31788/g.82960  ORF Transcript_31788/g.82960 Transcript_31788/m.82960 type:complete len:146 (-) Transcript_31788:2570-3007(-)
MSAEEDPRPAVDDDEESREQDRFLPIANISRIMKRVLPVNAKVSREAKEAVQECVSEFISFITSEASEKAQREKRKTITGQDLLWSITTLGFDNYVEPLKQHLHALRELEGEKGGLNKRAVNKLQNSEMFEFSGSSVESSNWFRY